MGPLFDLLDLTGVAVFAASGALTASRKQMDPIGFGLLAAVTAVGGGTLRDLLLDRPVFWLNRESIILVALAVAALLFFFAHRVQRRYRLLLWMDAIGITAYGVLGAHLALEHGTGPLTAMLMGLMTATFGGLLRDVIGNEVPLILGQELYATAALAAAACFVGLRLAGIPPTMALIPALAIGLLLRGGAIRFGWRLPRYRPRPGRPPE